MGDVTIYSDPLPLLSLFVTFFGNHLPLLPVMPFLNDPKTAFVLFRLSEKIFDFLNYQCVPFSELITLCSSLHCDLDVKCSFIESLRFCFFGWSKHAGVTSMSKATSSYFSLTYSPIFSICESLPHFLESFESLNLC